MATGYKNESRYQQLLEAVTNPEKFTYDADADPAYAALRKMYLREGKRATADTLAQTSAATGGRPSSYAVTAAQQAGDNYAAKLSDSISTLEQNAYQRYLNNLELKRNALGVLESDRNEYQNSNKNQISTTFVTNSDAVHALDQFASNTAQTVLDKNRRDELMKNEISKYMAAGVLTQQQAQSWWNQYYDGSGVNNSDAVASGSYTEYERAALNYLRSTYPNGNITNINDWQMAMEILGGLDALQKLGYTHSIGGGSPITAQGKMSKYTLN